MAKALSTETIAAMKPISKAAIDASIAKGKPSPKREKLNAPANKNEPSPLAAALQGARSQGQACRAILAFDASIASMKAQAGKEAMRKHLESNGWNMPGRTVSDQTIGMYLSDFQGCLEAIKAAGRLKD